MGFRFGGGDKEEVELGFANFKEKENPFTRVGASSAVFGSSNSSSSTPIPDNHPLPITSENVATGDCSRFFFGKLTSPAPVPVVDIQPPLLFCPPPNSTSALGQPIPFSSPCLTSAFGQPISSSFSPCQNSTSAIHQSSSNPFSASQTTAGGQQQSSGGNLFTSRIGIGESLFVTNPTTGGAAPISTCAFQQPSNTVPPNPLFQGPSIFSLKSSQSGGPCISSSHAVSQSGGQHSSGGFSLTVSSSPILSQSVGQYLSGSSMFSHSISSLPTVSQSGGQHSSGCSPFSSGISSLPAVSQAGGQHSSGWYPFSSVASSSPAVSQADGQHSSGWSPFSSTISRSFPFGVPLPSSTYPFNVDPLPSFNPFSLYSSVTTSPIHTRLPFSGLVVPTVDSRLRASTTSSTGPFTKSFVQENNTSSNCASVFAPFTRSNVRVTDNQGTRICSYAPTSAAENLYEGGELISISAMPMYKEKSHEVLRWEDYHLRPRFPNKSSTDSLPSSIPVISIPLSIEIRHLGDLLATTQITIPVPTCGTVPASNLATVTDAIITSIPEPVSTGGFRWPQDNRQTPSGPIGTEATDTLPTTVPSGISGLVVKPVPPEATVTLPTTVPYGISGLPISENHESMPPVEKYKPDDEDIVKFRKFFDVMAMMPKLKCPGYYTVPSMGDLIENELKRPGSCSQVKDFVIGRGGYGSIKFSGETDLRNLDLESMVQFNTREVIFCMDQKTKPPIGQGLNKAAEITLNVDCIDKNTGKRYIDGPKVDKYKELLVRKTMEQGAEFVSFDPAKGEWKFKVPHF